MKRYQGKMSMVARKQGYLWLILWLVAGEGYAATNTLASSDSLEQRVADLEAILASDDNWTPKRDVARVMLGGELEYEYVDTQQDAQTDLASPHFKLDKVTLQPRVVFPQHITLEALLLFKTARASASEAYVSFAQLPFRSSLKVGLDDRFIKEKPSRKTESFALIDSAFARDDAFAASWSGEYQAIYWHASAGNGYALGSQAPSEDKSYKFLHDNRQSGEIQQNQELGAGLGFKQVFDQQYQLDWFVFAYHARLSAEDVSFLQNISGYGNQKTDSKWLQGAVVEAVSDDYHLGGKYIQAQDGKLHREGWFAQISKKIPLENWHRLQAVEPLLRYGEMHIDLPPVSTDPYTWDRSMLTIALIAELVKNVKVKTEYYVNGEDTAGPEIDNDELMVQLEVKF